MSETIRKIDAFQVEWKPGNPRTANSAWLRIETETAVGYGEVSPMMGANTRSISSTVTSRHR